jgi:hypothetical protein
MQNHLVFMRAKPMISTSYSIRTRSVMHVKGTGESMP